MKYILNNLNFKANILLGLFLLTLQLNAVPQSDELVVLHNVTTAEMNAIVSPVEGALIFNTDNNEVYERNATAWHITSSDGSETKIIAGDCMEITGTGTTASPYVVTHNPPPRTCKEILDAGLSTGNGNYMIDADGCYPEVPFQVYCDMAGGGWTRIDYVSDLTHQVHFSGGDANRWLPTDFSLTLTDTQISNIRKASTQGKQRYHGTCRGVIHYNYNGNYNYAFGFRFHDGHQTEYNMQSYASVNIVVSNDGCASNGALSSTDFDINDIGVPIINVHSRDNGNNNEAFGSPLTNNPAWLR